MLKLKLQYFGHLMQRADSFEKTLMLGKIEGRGEGDKRGWDGWMASPTQCTWVWVNARSWWWTGRPGMLRFIGSQRVIHDWATELNWFKKNYWIHCPLMYLSRLRFSYWRHNWNSWLLNRKAEAVIVLCYLLTYMPNENKDQILFFLNSFHCFTWSVI